MGVLKSKTARFLARILPVVVVLNGCTVAQSQSRLRLQRHGSLPDWKKSPWVPTETPWLGEGFDDAKALAISLQDRLDQQLEVTELKESKPLHFVLGRPRVACKASPGSWRCYAQVIVEMRGKRGKRALWAAEGLAWVDLEQKPSKRQQRRLAYSLTWDAVRSVREGPQSRKKIRNSGSLAAAIERGSSTVVSDWLDELSQNEASESRRVALWLAIGHLATEEHRLRILSIQTGTQRETKARQLALDWLDEVVIPAN